MEETEAIRLLSALASSSRLVVFRLLAKSGEEGMSAGSIAAELNLHAATLSFHLKELSNAGLVTDRREGRSIFYAVRTATLKRFMAFLLKDIGGGNSEKIARSLRPPAPKSKRTRAV